MSKVLKHVSLVTENCEVFTLNGSDLIWTDYQKQDDIRNPFERSMSEVLGLCFSKDSQILLEKSFISSLQFNKRTDITWVEFVFDNDETEIVTICWPEGEENRYLTEHPGQRWFVTPEGNFMFQSWYATDKERMINLDESIYDLRAMDKKA
ncbi:hypothetical protein GAP32_414 [Cronobacter phage vB_CsaM_GAP32]|uniref:Uncharacterized protein n=1 Tax=Cronobacter phage vB_CsaM_GAP32 TaxID=1141136 RepID=K4F7Q6_9CAUD|nr:hypothetical protein GAP32_414 [Cronobacter phage vB_CsaM_GAP32]AFC21867.1 hypothetical protein GAP32_414 [Cronobacter phage vB_CsaM_GAP32]